MRLEITLKHWESVKKYLNSLEEKVAFLFANQQGKDSSKWRVDSVRLLGQSDYRQSNFFGVELLDSVRSEVIKQAHVTNSLIVEVHAHYGFDTGTQFSMTDLNGIKELAPQMVWRLNSRPYVAMVLGRGDYDCLVWPAKGTPYTLDSLIVDGISYLPSGLSLFHLLNSIKGLKNEN